MKDYHRFDPDSIDPVFLKQKKKEMKALNSDAGGLGFVVLLLFLLLLAIAPFIFFFIF